MGLFLKGLDWVASMLGVNLTVVALLVGSGGGGVVGGVAGYYVGDALGYNRGASAANKQAELNDAMRRIDEMTKDRAASDVARQKADEDAEYSRKQKDEADARVSRYEAALKARKDAGDCGFTDDDLNELRNDSWGKQPNSRPASPSGR